jgi:hypothetical protein
MIRSAALTLGCAALYGFALGSAHSELYALRNLLKFPLLLATTGAVCALSWWFVARLVGAPLSFLGTQRAAGMLFKDASALLASLAPVVFFVARCLRATDDGQLGGYDAFLASNLAAVALCGGLALRRQSRALLRGAHLSRARARTLVASWLVLTLAVGGQGAFYLRPFFGFPATRGARPPLFLGPEPDVRGATNFFEAVAQTLARPALPQKWPERPERER